MWWPAASRRLRGKPRAVATLLRAGEPQAPASTVEQGQPGIEPGRTLAVAAGLLGPEGPSKHNGLLHEVWPVVRCAHFVSTPLRLSPCALRVHATPVMSCAPPPLHAAPACSSCRAQYRFSCGHGKPSPQALQPGAARSLEGWPRPTTHRPRGAPQRTATTERTPSTDPPA